jgi:hypothetical protein
MDDVHEEGTQTNSNEDYKLRKKNNVTISLTVFLLKYAHPLKYAPLKPLYGKNKWKMRVNSIFEQQCFPKKYAHSGKVIVPPWVYFRRNTVYTTLLSLMFSRTYLDHRKIGS